MRRALISVTDKSNLHVIASAFQRHDIGILSTGGTARALRQDTFSVEDVSTYTEYPELFDGRLKTIHPKLAGGYLYNRDNEVDVNQAIMHQIEPIDFVVVNLYNFQKIIARPTTSLAEAIEQIDIGGPTALRAAVKNHQFVTVIIDPADYNEVAREMDKNEGETTYELRFRLACKVFRVIKNYENTISSYLDAQPGSGSTQQPSLAGILAT